METHAGRGGFIRRAGTSAFTPRPVRGRILVAEDDPDARSLVAAGLRHSGYEVMEAGDGMDAVDCIAASRTRGATFTAVVMGVEMPLLTGLDVLCALRCAAIDVPVILVTAFGDASSRAEGRELGATLVLEKPLNLNDLRAAVQAATMFGQEHGRSRGPCPEIAYVCGGQSGGEGDHG